MANALAFTIIGKDEGSAAFRKFGNTVRKTYADVDKAGKGVAKAGGTSGVTLGKSFLGGLAGVLTFQAVKGVFSTVVAGASNLNETVSATNQIFGSSAKSINNWGKQAAASMGLSQQAAQSNANSLGLLFTQVGFNTTSAAAMSKKWVQLAVDLGSFANADPTEILGAMQSATRGEFDELQRFVPMISAATVEQKALQITGKKTTDELTAQDKVLAVQALAFEQTGKAQGDFSRTQSGVANSTKTARAEFDNLTASIGKGLQPAVAGTLHFISGDLIPTINEMDDVFRDLPKGVQIGAGAIAGLAGSSAIAIPAAKKITAKINEVRDAYLGLSRLGKITSLSFGAVGIAITAGVAILGAYAKRQAEAKAAVESLTQSLDDQKANVTASTRLWARDELAKNGAKQAAKDLGIGLNDLITAGLDPQSAAAARVNATLGSYKTIADGAYGATTQFSAASAENAAKAALVEGALKGQNNQLDEARAKKKEDISVSKGGADANQKLGDSQKTAAQKAKEQADALQAVIEKLTKLSNLALAASDAEIGYQQAVDDARAALKENGKTLDTNTQKGRDNRKALDEIASATNNLIDKKAQEGAKEPTLQRLRDRGTAAFYRQARQMGLNATEADKLTKKYFGIPGSVLTKLQADKRDADAKVRDIKRKLNDKDLTKTRRAKLQADYRNAVDGARRAQNAINRVHGKTVYIYVEQRNRSGSLLGDRARAEGGPVTRGQAYIVGEKRPELFVPKTDGMIIPKVPRHTGNGSPVGGGGGLVINGGLHFHIDGTQPTRKIAQDVQRELLRLQKNGYKVSLGAA